MARLHQRLGRRRINAIKKLIISTGTGLEHEAEMLEWYWSYLII